MQRLLIILGLIIIPFYEIFLKALPCVRSIAPDSRMPKEIIALVFALSIGLLAVWHGKLKSFRNKFLLIIPIYLLFNLIMAPHIDLNINNNEVGDFYFWKPFSQVMCFTFMIIAISSLEIDIKEILKVMVFCGVVMAGYVILQKFGLDQFWAVKTDQVFTSVRGEAMGGNLGQPTVVASWMIMMVPLAFYLKRFWMAFTIILACILTQGAMVSGSLIFILFLYMIYFFHMENLVPMRFITPIIILIISIGGFFIINNKSYVINRMDGRYEVWKNTISDVRNGQIVDGQKFPITGVGLGRFSFTFPSKNHSLFQQTHNDILEFIYDTGLVGGFLLIAGIYIMIMNIHITPLSFSILLSFIGILFCSFGSFPFQLGAHQFYSAVLVGFLNNESLIRRV